MCIMLDNAEMMMKWMKDMKLKLWNYFFLPNIRIEGKWECVNSSLRNITFSDTNDFGLSTDWVISPLHYF